MSEVFFNKVTYQCGFILAELLPCLIVSSTNSFNFFLLICSSGSVHIDFVFEKLDCIVGAFEEISLAQL